MTTSMLLCRQLPAASQEPGDSRRQAVLVSAALALRAKSVVCALGMNAQGFSRVQGLADHWDRFSLSILFVVGEKRFLIPKNKSGFLLFQKSRQRIAGRLLSSPLLRRSEFGIFLYMRTRSSRCSLMAKISKWLTSLGF